MQADYEPIDIGDAVTRGHETRQRSFSRTTSPDAEVAAAALDFDGSNAGLQNKDVLSTSASVVFVTMVLYRELIGGFASFKLNSCPSVI